MIGSPPAGWRRVALGDLVHERDERAESAPQAAVYSVTKYDGFVPSLEYFGRQVFSRNTANYRVVRRGDLAYATIHLDEGSLGLFDAADAGLISPMYTVLNVTDPSVEARVLFHLLKRPATIAQIGRLGEGSVHRRRSILYSALRKVELNLPPLAEQHAIAGILDGIDDTVERTETVIAASEQLGQALLHELLTRGVPGLHAAWRSVPGVGTVPACWDIVPLARATVELRYGTSRPLSSERSDGAIAVLRIPNVARGIADFSDLKYAELPAHEALALTLQAGDLLIVRTNGNPAICGRSVVFDQPHGRWAFASYLLRLRTDASLLDPNYLWIYLQSRAGRSQLDRSIRTSAGNYNLSASGLAALQVALPPVAEQVRIIDIARQQGDVLARVNDEVECLRNFSIAMTDALLTGRVQLDSQASSRASDLRLQAPLAGPAR